MRKFILFYLLVLLPSLAFCQSKPVLTKAAKKARRDSIRAEKQDFRVVFRIKFDKVFKIADNGEVVALYPVKLNTYMLQQNAVFPENELLGGISLNNIRGRDLLIDTVKGVVIYKGFFK